MRTTEWFTVDREGLAKILKRKGIEFAVFELIQNAWDETGVGTVEVELGESDTRGYSTLRITDDAPEGFKDLTHAYTLFAPSEKKNNAEQRGRFNLGEKLVLSLCKWASITTTKGMIVFDGEGRSVSKRTTRPHGTQFEALIKMNAGDRMRVADACTKLIPPAEIKTTINGIPLIPPPKTAAQFKASLPTELADEEGMLREATRQTLVTCYKAEEGQPAFIYEMGIPVVEHDCAFHVNVEQKVPLTLDRENVKPSFLRKLHTEVYNHTHDQLTVEQTTNGWAQTAIESKDATTAAVHDYMGKRFGERRVSYDPSDPEANHKAVAHGFTLVHGSMLSREAWSNARDHEAITPAGQVFPTHSNETVPFEAAEPTPEMRQVGEYAKQFARETIGKHISVVFGKQRSREGATYGGRRLQFNVGNLGQSWFALDTNRTNIDDLIIHELGHEYSANHLSEEYYNALTRIAALALKAVREGRLP